MARIITRLTNLLLVGLLPAIGLVCVAPSAQAHRDGCHAAHSCPSDTGSYVCGDTGNFSECGYTSIPEYVEPDYAAPRRPKISTLTTGHKGLIKFIVTAEDGSTIRVQSGRRTLLTMTATGGRQALSFTGITGEREYVVTATDSSGNESSVAAFNATADATAPTVARATIVSGTAEDARSMLSVDPSEYARYALSVDNKVVKRGSLRAGDAKIVFPTPNGVHRIVLRLVDQAGNVSTFRKNLKVRIVGLVPIVELATAANVTNQVFTITGTPGAAGTINIGDVTRQFKLTQDSLNLEIPLADGSYESASVNIADRFGRRGTASVPSFVVDTVRPTVKITRIARDKAKGRLAALIGAEVGATVLWRIRDNDGDVVKSATYVATGAERTIDEDVDEGDYTLSADVTDEAGNVMSEELDSEVGKDPVAATTWMILLILLVLLIAVVLTVWRKLGAIREWIARRRHRLEVTRTRRAHEAALAAHAHLLCEHQAAMTAHRSSIKMWNLREDALTALLAEALTFQGEAQPSGTALLHAKVKPGERIYSVVSGAMIDQRTRQNVPVLVQVERGRVAVTNLRILFEGDSKKREWFFDKVEHLRHIDGDTTLLTVSNRKAPSGVEYCDTERTRVHIDLALAESSGERHQVADVVRAKLLAHEQARPTEPPAPSDPPPLPALLLAAKSNADLARK